MRLEDLKCNILDQLSAPIAVTHRPLPGRSTRLVYVNRAFTELFGYAPEAIPGDTALHDLENLLPFGLELTSTLSGQKPNTPVETQLVNSDGAQFSASISFSVIESENSEETYICATYQSITYLEPGLVADKNAATDISETGLSKRALEPDDTRLRDAISASPVPFVIYDRDDRLFFWNAAFETSVCGDLRELSAGMTRKAVLLLGVKHGRFPQIQGQEPDWLEQQLSGSGAAEPFSDLEPTANVHRREYRTRLPNGDSLIMGFDTTDLVHQWQEADKSHSRLMSALNAYPDPIVIYDSDLKLVFRNTGYATSVTDTPDEIVEGIPLRDVLRLAARHQRHPVAIGREDAWVDEILSSNSLESPSEDVELQGDIHHRLMRSRSANGDYIVIRLNSTELVRQKRAAEAAQARLLAALNAYPAPFVIYDSDDCLVVCNDAYRASMSDQSESIKLGMHRTEVARIAVRAGKITNAVGSEKKWMSDKHQQAELDKAVQDLELPGDIHHRLLRSRVENGDLVILRIDTTELVRQRRALEQYSKQLETANSEITHMALHDDLTGLGNRRYLSKKFDEFVDKRIKTGGEIAALHIDLDRFKQINDTMGHAAGDAVLLDVSNRISETIGSKDVVARIGGDEFIVLLHLKPDSNRPLELAESLLKDLARPTPFEGKECRFGVSIGIAKTPLAEIDQLLTNSDLALYKAKRRGRGQLGIFDRTDLEEVHNTKALADDLLRALEQAEFEPFFQPQVDAKTHQIVGMEVLARWQHPEKGILEPDIFLPVATDLNIASEIDRQIFEKAIAQCQATFGPTTIPLPLSFNVSESRISSKDMPAIRQHVQAYAGQISFELLETIFLEEQDADFLLRLDQLREIGIAIEIDDFGSGRASVVALQRINPDRLKIDRRLVALVTKGSSGLRLLRSIIEIGHALEMGVTAEGVETREQSEILSTLGCERLQGYYFAKPMAFLDLLTYLEMQDQSARDA